MKILRPTTAPQRLSCQPGMAQSGGDWGGVDAYMTNSDTFCDIWPTRVIPRNIELVNFNPIYLVEMYNKTIFLANQPSFIGFLGQKCLIVKLNLLVGHFSDQVFCWLVNFLTKWSLGWSNCWFFSFYTKILLLNKPIKLHFDQLISNFWPTRVLFAEHWGGVTPPPPEEPSLILSARYKSEIHQIFS